MKKRNLQLYSGLEPETFEFRVGVAINSAVLVGKHYEEDMSSESFSKISIGTKSIYGQIRPRLGKFGLLCPNFTSRCEKYLIRNIDLTTLF
jgi:hypothetical protein